MSHAGPADWLVAIAESVLSNLYACGAISESFPSADC
jgi:hypothetical protein